MTLNQAVKKIAGNIPETEDRILVAEKDSSADYDVDIEEVWITRKSEFVWRYASGCSCWGGEYDEDNLPTVKEFVVKCDEEWQNAVIKFAETGKVQDLG
jgi:hypothetical protein